MPWFYPVEDANIYDLCDPWQTAEFQKQIKMVPDGNCTQCLPDCKNTKFKATVSGAPFRNCDRTNLGTSSLCMLKDGVVDPPIWMQAVTGEYHKYNNGTVPNYVNANGTKSSNMRKYPLSSNLVLRNQRENDPSYDAFENDIATVNFYFDEPTTIQYTTFITMTPIDFISQVR